MSHSREMLEAAPEPIELEAGELAAAIDAIADAVQTCTSCADSSLAEPDVSDLRQCIRLNLDCADVCAATGRVREVTLAPQEGWTRIVSLIVNTKSGNHVLPFSAISSIAATTKTFHDRTPVGLPDAVEFEGAVIDLCLDRNDLSLDRAAVTKHGWQAQTPLHLGGGRECCSDPQYQTAGVRPDRG